MPLVRHGANERLRRQVNWLGQVICPGHTMGVVYREMIYQITRDYSGLPDVRTLTLSQIRFFYEGLRGELLEHTKKS